METLRIETKRLKQVVDLTEKVHTIIQKRHFKEGVCSLFLPHTTAALTTGEVGEGTDEDLLEVAEQMIPKIRFRHAHDPSHAWSHMAASIFGASLHLPVNNGTLCLGTWQSVLLVELDGPRERTITVTLLSSL